jgi:hypothetical protein
LLPVVAIGDGRGKGTSSVRVMHDLKLNYG